MSSFLKYFSFSNLNVNNHFANLESSFFFSEPDRLRLLDADLPDLDLAGDLVRLRLRLCLLSDLPLLLRDLERDLDLERLRDLFFFL